MGDELEELFRKSREALAKMTQAELDEMFRLQRESFVRSEMEWPKPKFQWINGVKVYDSYEDYCND